VSLTTYGSERIAMSVSGAFAPENLLLRILLVSVALQLVLIIMHWVVGISMTFSRLSALNSAKALRTPSRIE
jgi:hypothetical protein